MCSITPATITSVPSASASTSTSIARRRYRSKSTGCSSATANASTRNRSSSSTFRAISIARPPSTNDGRTTSGNPSSRPTAIASPSVIAVAFSGCRNPSRSSNPLKSARSSARSIASGVVPKIFTPAAASPFASFNGVCPPSCTITPRGRSRATIASTDSSVSGSKYSRSAVS